MRQGDTTGALLSAAAILLCGYIPVISSKLQTSGYYNKIKRVFGAGRVLVTTIKRVHVELMFTAFTFNLYQLCTLKKAKVI